MRVTEKRRRKLSIQVEESKETENSFVSEAEVETRTTERIEFSCNIEHKRSKRDTKGMKGVSGEEEE
jgi:hypothetical protein